MKTILMNGCYDVVHLGHLRSFNASREYGDTLIVAINSDRAVKELKGDSRPINNQENRAEFLKNIIDIDEVIVFDSTNVCDVLNRIRPKVWLKSGYTEETINQEEYKLAKKLGIEVVFLPKIEGLSTSKIAEKIMNEN